MKKRLATSHAFVLAGGESRRMGSDKLFMSVDGELLLARTLRVCRAVFSEVAIVAKSAEKFSNFGAKVVIDSPEAPGPLGGIIAALTECPTESCLIVAADLADLDVATVQSLCDKYHGEDYLGIREANGIQPLCGIYSTSAVRELISVASKNKPYQMWRIVESMDSRFLPIYKSIWRNINTPADIQTQSRRGGVA